MMGFVKRKEKSKQKATAVYSFGKKRDGAKVLGHTAYGNCDCRGGVLRGGIGLIPYLDANGAEVTIRLNEDSMMKNTFFSTIKRSEEREETPAVFVVGMDNYLYHLHEPTGNGWQKKLLSDDVEHYLLRGEDKVLYNIFYGKDGVLYTLDAQIFKEVYTGENVGGCLCGERCLVLTKNGELHYSAVFAPFSMQSDDPNGGGIIYLPTGYGDAVGAKAYGDNAYIFFERGIFKLSFSATATKNSLKEIPYHGGDICLRAQAVTNDGIMFLAREGVYYLRGDKVERICEDLPIGPCAADKVVKVGRCEDVVMFSYMQEGDESGLNKRVAIYEDGKEGYFTDEFGPCGGNEYAYLEGKIYRYVKDCKDIWRQEQPFYISKKLRLGSDKNKRLKTLVLQGEGVVTVGVRCGGKERKYTLTFQDGVAKTRLLEKGKAFTFCFYLDGGSCVEGMELEYATEE